MACGVRNRDVACHILLLDPWITNPANPNGKEDLAAIKKADLLFITHGHFDHIGDSVAIAKSTGAQLVASYDLSSTLVADLGFPEKQATAATKGNSGGAISVLDGEVNITFVPAVHGSSITVPGTNGGHYTMDPKGRRWRFSMCIRTL